MKKTKRIVAFAAVGLAAYFLSSGPVIYLVRHEMLKEKVFRFVYKPLTFLEEWRPYVIYLRWWYHTKAEREWIAAEETWTATQWLQHAMGKLQKQGAPSPDLIQSFPPKQWADKGYLLFDDGWAAFTSHSSHDSQKIGDIGLLLTSDGDFYTNDFHFCMGNAEFQGPKQIQPKNFSHFVDLYEAKQRWKRMP